ncbi:MAG TPA: glycosyltransferase family 4 protein [Vicinamibacterales bacterium]
MTTRVLFAIHGPADPATAVFSNVMHRKECLEAAGCRVEVLTAEDLAVSWIPGRLNPLVLPLTLLGRSLASYDAVIFHSYLGWAFYACRSLVDRARHPFTVTMFHGLEPTYHEAVAAELRRIGRPVSRRFRLLHHVIVRRLLKFACTRADAVFCLNTAEAAYLTSHRWVKAERLHVVSNAVEETAIDDARESRSGKRLVTVAQWMPVKGMRYLAEAFARIARKDPAVTLTCAGTGVGIDQVLATFPEDVRPRVTVLPRLDRSGVFAELRRADIFVLPSLFEGSSLALIEALMAGLPVVCTRVGAAPDVLRDGVDAVLVPPADAQALVTALERLTADEQLRRTLGENARAVGARFSWPAVCPGYRIHLLNLVKAHVQR